MSFLFLILCGNAVGFSYDVFRAMRIKTKYNAAISVICDFLFWLLTIILTFFVLYKYYSFNLRLYHFLLISAGCSLYFAVFSGIFGKIILKILNIFEFFLKIVFTIIKFCGKILKKCFLFLTFPLRWVFKKIVILFKILKSKLIKHTKKLSRL